jgi:hypothetical protein
MNIVCIAAQGIGREGTAGIVRASFVLDGLVTLADITVVLDESTGASDVSIPQAPAGNPALLFLTPFARRAFAALLAQAVTVYAANIVATSQAAEKMQSLAKTIDTLTSTVDANTRELLSKVRTGGGVN